MPDPELERLLRHAYAAFGSGDFEAALELFADDARYVNPDDALEPGTREGHDGVLTAFRSLYDQFSFDRIEIEEIHERPGCVLVIGLFGGTGRASGAPVELRFNHVIRLQEGPRASALEWYFERGEAERAAGLS